MLTDFTVFSETEATIITTVLPVHFAAHASTYEISYLSA